MAQQCAFGHTQTENHLSNIVVHHQSQTPVTKESNSTKQPELNTPYNEKSVPFPSFKENNPLKFSV